MVIQCQMIMQQILRSENYQLKNQITDLKNAFNLNRDILRILSTYSPGADPHQHLLMQIISRLTTLNNQAMLNALELTQEKHILKQENLKLNLQNRQLESRLGIQVQLNRNHSQPSESRLIMQEQFNALNRELLAANEERITHEQEIQYWKHKFNRAQTTDKTQNTSRMARQQLQKIPQNVIERDRTSQIKQMPTNMLKMEQEQIQQGKQRKIKRKYTSASQFKYQVLNRQLLKEINRLKRYVQQLQNRLLVFVKAYNISPQLVQPVNTRRGGCYQREREQVRLLKYALNDVKIQRHEDEYLLTITERFKEKDSMNNTIKANRRSTTWPKYSKPTWSMWDEQGREKEESRWEEKAQTRMTQQEY